MIKLRAKFYKTGSMRFIGHLDIMRYFQKAFRRAEIDISYSQGFNPHQLLSFASPLGVGHTSEGEYLDMQLDSFDDLDGIKNALNKAMTEELQIINIIKLPEESKTSMSLLAGADYLISVKDGYTFVPDFKNRFEQFINQPTIPIRKKTKKGEQEIDLKDYIYAYGFEKEEFKEKIKKISFRDTSKNNIQDNLNSSHPENLSNLPDERAFLYENGNKVFLQLTCGSVHNIKPELVMEEFLKRIGLEYNPFSFQVHRIEMYTDVNALKGEVNLNSSKKGRKLTALDSI